MPPETLTADEQAQLDQMQADDSLPEQEDVAQPGTVAEPEESADVEKKDKDAAPRQKLVPHQALHEERERRKEADRQLQQEREARARLDQRTNLILEQLAQQRGQGQTTPEIAPRQEIPDPDKDPIGYMAAQQSALTNVVQALATQFEAQRNGQQQMSVVQQLQMQASAAEADYRRDNPEYDTAAAFLRNKRDEQLKMMGYNPVERTQVLQQEALSLAARALQQGQNPAEIIYNLAANNGYTPAGRQQANGHDPEVQIGQDVQAHLRTVERGQRDTASLGQMAGAAPPKLTAQRLLEMSDGEFEKMMKTAEGRALLG